MESIRIQTTQNIDIEYKVASIGDRILANIIDYLVILAYILLAFSILNQISKFSQWAESYVIMTIFILPVLFYHFFFEALFDGQSLGKMTMKIKVARLDGGQPSLGNYFMRWIMRLIDIMLTSGGLATLFILITENAQRLGDLAAGTVVIKTSFKDDIDSIRIPEIPEGYTPDFPQVTQLTDKDMVIIKDVINGGMLSQNMTIITTLAEKVESILQTKTDMPALKFLNTVIKDYNMLNRGK